MGPKCPKIAMFRPGEIGGFDIPYVHIHVYVFKGLKRKTSQKLSFFTADHKGADKMTSP